MCPTSQPPVRTNSSQFPAPAALTSISTCPASNDGGSGSSRSATSAPNASMPAALKLTRGLSRDPPWRARAARRPEEVAYRKALAEDRKAPLLGQPVDAPLERRDHLALLLLDVVVVEAGAVAALEVDRLED